jgi:uncharacterized protein
MNVQSLRQSIGHPPWRPRVLPFALFLGFTFLQGHLGDASAFWIYALKSFVGAAFLWLVWPLVAEMRWRFSLEAVLAGILVFVLWVGLDPLYPGLSGESEGWNPHLAFGHNSLLAWTFILIRILGSTLVVPALEEVFYRSFLYRWLAKADFQQFPLGQFAWWPFLGTSLIFGLAHREWLAGILCGLIYQTLVCRHKRLGDAMTAHAITNFLLGCWVVAKGAWYFW